MKIVGIESPCSEKFEDMSPTTHGAFCQQCTKQVLNFTEKSTEQIRAVLYANKGKSLCVRMTNVQEQQLNDDYFAWKASTSNHMRKISVFAIVLVFGLSIVSCSDEQDKQVIQELHQQTMQILANEAKNTVENNLVAPIVAQKIVPPRIIEEELQLIDEPEIIIEQYLEEVQIIENQVETHQIHALGGAMVSISQYSNYLDQVVPATATRYDENGIPLPADFAALAYPNPTSGAFTLKLETPAKMKATIAVFSLDGRMILNLEQNKYAAGTHEIALDLSNQVSGTYIVSLISKDYKENLRVVKL